MYGIVPSSANRNVANSPRLGAAGDTRRAVSSGHELI
jgi:hypothetical protein